ncbi:hypothetical protein DMC63_05040 [Streptomyces sp. WAC 05977]|nr:hypothetical protein DMC63_05040 [Streptomyces sp. WAC 05977]
MVPKPIGNIIRRCPIIWTGCSPGARSRASSTGGSRILASGGGLVSAIVALGHAAGQAVDAKQLTLEDGVDALAESVLRLCGAARRD